MQILQSWVIKSSIFRKWGRGRAWSIATGSRPVGCSRSYEIDDTAQQTNLGRGHTTKISSKISKIKRNVKKQIE